MLCILSFGSIHAEITWNLSSNGTLTISGTDMYWWYLDDIPWFSKRDKIKKVIIENGVINIGEKSFSGCSNLTSVTIPNSVTSIERSAFEGCSSLTSVTIPESVTSIESSVFSGCSKLTSVTIPNSVTGIDWYAFNGCSSLTSVTIPESVKNIGEYAFQDCSSLTSITIPNSVTRIEKSTFSGCSSLTSVTIPESVTSIGGKAFYGCESLATLAIPNSVTIIGENAFDGTKWFNNQPNGLLYIGHILYKYKGKMPSNTRIDIKEGTTCISGYAFDGCSNLTSITIPNSVVNIGDNAFLDCKRLTSITIPNSVTSIGDRTFSGCSSLTSITIPNSVKSIGDKAFENCSILASVTIPNSVTRIDQYAFWGCSSLTSITIPNSVNYIDRGIFIKCSSLTSITIPNSVVIISGGAFSGCSSLTSITIPNSVTSIGDNAFNGCSSLTSITIPESVTSIESSVFSGCSKLTSVTIPNSVTGIDWYAFNGCSSLTSVTIPESVKNIGEYAFQDCSSLTSITIPNSVTRIESSVFSGCSKLTSVTIPNSVTSIGSFAFYNCSSLTSITIPNSVTSFDIHAFDSCSGLTSIAIPNSVTSIEDYTFFDCTALTSVTIPESVTTIGPSAFSWCSALTSIHIPNSVSSIGIYAFQHCDSLKKVVIEVNKDLDIGPYIYMQTDLEELIMIGENIPKSTNDNFAYKMYQKAILYVPSSLYDEYRSTYPWNKFANIMTLEHSDEANKIVSDAVIAKINAIGKVEYTDACKNRIDDACTAYDALADVQKALVTNIDVLTTAKQTYDNLRKLAADKAIADAVVAKITAIGKVEYTDACKSKIDDANTAYEALTDDQKALVTNLDVLTTAKQTYEALKTAAEKLAADKAAANKVVNKIKAIGTVEYTDDCKSKIDAASKAYEALTDDQKAHVTNLNVLTKAKKTYETLKAAAEKLAADKAAAEPVIAKINSIGKVEYTYACKDKIDEANNAYNALTADQKALVTNLDVLTTAKLTYDNLKDAADKLAEDKAAFDKYKSEIIAIIESLVKEDDSDAVKEIINKAISEIDALKYEDAISLDDNKAKVNSFATSVNEAVENQRAEDEKTNGIEEPELAEKVNIYDLNGRKITNSMLKSGLYIRNGKKVVVK